MSRRLPIRHNLEFYRKRAKKLLRQYRADEEAAAIRIRSVSNRLHGGLSDAQRVVAREAGFGSWAQLKESVASAPVHGGAQSPDVESDRHRAKSSQPKQRYEDNLDVQRWLKGSDAETGGGFHSPFVEGQRDRDWIISSLGMFYASGLIRDVVGVVKSGKEATVYRCTGQKDGEYLAAKIFRPRMFRSLQNDAIYRQNRDAGRDLRSRRAMDKMSTHGRATRMESWIRFEFDTHKRFYDAGVAVPEPVDSYGNAILMEFIGDGEEPAPLLNQVELESAAAEPLFGELIRSIELMVGCDRVHADLSPFNILYRQGQAIVIDFAQAVDAGSGPDVFRLLVRDIENVATYFAKYGVAADPEQIAFGMWSRHLGPERAMSAGHEPDGGCALR